MIDPLLIPIAGMAIPLIIVPVALGCKHATRARELTHAERMRALELGRRLPQDQPWWTPARLGLAIGAGVPLAVFVCAAVATAAAGFQDGIWIATLAVGLTAVVCGSILAGRSALGGTGNERVDKPFVEEDAFDVVGARG